MFHLDRRGRFARRNENHTKRVVFMVRRLLFVTIPSQMGGKLRRKGKFYWKSFALLLALACLPGVAIDVVRHWALGDGTSHALREPLPFAAAALPAAAACAWFACRALYSPIERLLRSFGGPSAASPTPPSLSASPSVPNGDEFRVIESEWRRLLGERTELERRLRFQLPQAKAGFLLQLVQGFASHYSERELRERMKRLGWPSGGGSFVVCFVRLHGFGAEGAPFAPEEDGLAAFAAANVAEELGAIRFAQADAALLPETTVALLLTSGGAGTSREELQTFAGELIDAVRRLLRLKVTVSISGASGTARDIPRLAAEAKRALRHRSFERDCQWIDVEQLREDAFVPVGYPATLESEIAQTIRSGLPHETLRLVEAFQRAIVEQGGRESDVQQAMLQLLGASMQAMLQAGVSVHRLYPGVDWYEELSRCKDPAELLQWFERRVLAPYAEALEGSGDRQAAKTIEQALTYVEAHYTGEVTLELCAAWAGTTPNALSRTFKKVTGKNFVEYVTELRMNKAKELLRDTQLKMNEVAEAVGYKQSYFNRMFKKQEGLTPGEYRARSRTNRRSRAPGDG